MGNETETKITSLTGHLTEHQHVSKYRVVSPTHVGTSLVMWVTSMCILLVSFHPQCRGSEVTPRTNVLHCCLSLANCEHSATVLFDRSLTSSVHLRLSLPRFLLVLLVLWYKNLHLKLCQQNKRTTIPEIHWHEASGQNLSADQLYLSVLAHRTPRMVSSTLRCDQTSAIHSTATIYHDQKLNINTFQL